MTFTYTRPFRVTWTLSNDKDGLDDVAVWADGECLAHLERETKQAFYLNVYAPDGRILQLHIEGKHLRVWGEEA